MKKLISALMLAALASTSVMATEGVSLAATRGGVKARHSMVAKKHTKRVRSLGKKRTSSRKHIRKASAPGVKTGRMPAAKSIRKVKSVGKIVRAHKARGRKSKTAVPAEPIGSTPLPISQ